ncbi:hypothetical protein LH413_14225 [Yersinia massiliensis]|uniref:hypothetical protein n=1 Tax=Yersinia massiliensis TaxID=419257 RepID=UPI001CFDA289|nr:hypothetical protein [Yersinia massiliensis]MCB5318648.1 hypothetical protein [Yersinia massiliensis]
MKELDSFTVEQLTEFIESDHAQCGDVSALARIALAAKRAEESHSRREVWDGGNTWVQCSRQAYDRHEAAGQRVRVLYERPQLNSPEIPEGWKLVPIIAYPSQWAAGQKAHNNSGINKVDAVYKAMVAAAPDASGFDPSLPGAEATVITHYHTPDGYKLVPTDITKAMRDAWDSTPNNHEDDDVNMCNAYRAMIAAAPEKPL